MADTDPVAKPTHHKTQVYWTLDFLEEAYVKLTPEEKQMRLKKVMEMCGKYHENFDFSLEKIKELAQEAASDYARIVSHVKAEDEKKEMWEDKKKRKMFDSVLRALIIPDSDESKVKIAYFLAIVFHVGIDDKDKQNLYLNHMLKWVKAKKARVQDDPEKARVQDDPKKVIVRHGYYRFHLEIANKHTLYNRLLVHKFTSSTDMPHLHISDNEVETEKMLKAMEETFDHKFKMPVSQKLGTRRNRVKMAVRT